MGAKAATVDFSGVKDRGEFSPKQVPTGDYAAKITKVDDKPSKEGKPMYCFTVKLQKFSQNSYPYYCVIQDNQLWKLRNIAVAAGINVPKKRMKFDPNKLVGKSVGVTMEDDDPYEGKVKSVVAAVFPIAELADGAEVEDDDEDNFDEESAPQIAGDEDDTAEDEAAEEPKAKKKKKKAEPEAEAEPAKKKKKKKKGSDGDLEELDISDV
jgi:hypothetical protein